MTKKRRYRAISVNDAAKVAALTESVAATRVAVGIDIAKTRQFAAFSTPDGRVHGTIRWEHPKESPQFVEVLRELAGSGSEIEVVLEPSGTYGDALRAALLRAELPVYRVNPKRSHDAAEVYDGVPSLHDAKSAAILAKLHFDGASEPWPVTSTHQRDLAAALRVLDIYQKQFQQNRNRLEGVLARFWPELSRVLDLGSVTLLTLVSEFGSPREVSRRREEAHALMIRVGGHQLDPEKVKLVLDQAEGSFGMEPTHEERLAVQAIAIEARRCQKAARAARKKVEALTDMNGPAREMRGVVGKTTAAVLVAAVGDPTKYGSTSAYQKALGLNLKEKSSGKHQGALHITKRGPGVARLFLYLAALRLVQRDPIVKAWYAKKVARQGGIAKNRAVVAVMRKLAKALWHVAAGAAFDSRKLFDVSRLHLPMEPQAEASA